ncbi:hypothetical protein BKA62DRAFT_819045, partial [Auriculariales sp. MPI-PUGE-AT-0066]
DDQGRRSSRDFRHRPQDIRITNYTLTGYPNDLRLVTEPTIVFANKTVTLTDAQRAGSKVDKFSIDEDSAEIRFRFSAGKIKYQIKDLPQGGMFQLETELSTAVEHVHTLGETLFYFKNPYTGKVNGGNELPAVSKAEDAVNYHHMLLVKDSPQVANSTFQGSKVSKWLVQPGGRLGGVLGEDATEMGAGATNCTSHCQAQNQIQDGATVPSDPTSDTPLPDPTTTSV